MRYTNLTEPAERHGSRHDTTTIALHWTTAILVMLLWAIGQTMSVFPDGPLRINYRSVHIVLGFALAAILLIRLAWRLTRGESVRSIDHGVLLLLARVTHWSLYLLLILTVALGIGTAWVRGDAIFNLFSIPAYDPGNHSLIRLIRGWHALAANAVLIVAGIHAAAALFHHFVLRDVTLQRMLPWARR